MKTLLAPPSNQKQLMFQKDSLVTETISASTLVIFDDRVSDLHILYQALLPEAVGFTISAQDDGLQFITYLLAETGAKYLVIVAHGEPGVIHLGKSPVNLAQLQAQSHLLQEWGVKEISLYCCEVAKNDIGENFVFQLSKFTETTVSASANNIGSAKIGGSWNLTVATDVSTAPIVFKTLILQTYQFMLPAIQVLAGTNPIEGTIIGSFEFSLDAPAPVGGIIVNFITTGSTATPNIDYILSAGTGITAVTTNTFTIAAGNSHAILNISALSDTVTDPNETITLRIAPGIAYTNGVNFKIKNATNFAVGNAPRLVIARDFNGDGKLDLATLNQGDSSVSILLGNGNGTFGAATNFNVGMSLTGTLTSGDFNNDGKIDLVAGNSVLLGNGNGTFGTAINFSAGISKAGDFNNDGKLDLIVGNSVLLDNGDGTFGIAIPIAVVGELIELGDFNGDGKLDLFTYFNNSIYNETESVLTGNGDGTFTNAYSLMSPYNGFHFYKTGDFNGDGKTDLIRTSNMGVSISLGNSNGNILYSNTYNVGNPSNLSIVGSSITSLTVGDFNGDGKLDIITRSNQASVLCLSVLLGNGNGTFGSPSFFDNNVFALGNLGYTTAGDFNGDGSLDLVAISTNSNVSILLNNVDTLTIIDNTSPTDVSLSAYKVNENVAVNSIIGDFSSIDPQAGNTFTYSLVSGIGATDNNAFNISGNQLRINVSPDFETKFGYSIRVRTTDQGGLFFEKSFNINILDLNEVPTSLNLSASSINENVVANAIIGNLSSVDPDTSSTFTYSLVSGVGALDNTSFAIIGNQLSINTSPDFETKSNYSIRVRTTDEGGLFFEKSLSININDIPEAPTDLNLSSNSVNENVAANTIIGNLGSTDPDVNNTFTYSLVNGVGATNNSSFTIIGNQLIINTSPDFETKSIYNIRVRTVDQGGLFFEKSLAISINNLNEAPTSLNINANSINENVAANTIIGSLSSIDPDVGNTFTYSLVSGVGATDNIAFSVIGNQLKINTSPDFEKKI
jgi:Domain of unknown function (DUF4347)/FG-GAP-like repeat